MPNEIEATDNWSEWRPWQQQELSTKGRFENLFADLEAELGAADQADLAYEVADRFRGEYAHLRLVDRLHAALGQPIALVLPRVGVVNGELRDVGADWLLLTTNSGREYLVPLPAISVVDGLVALSRAPGTEAKVAAKRGLRIALRRLAHSRAQVQLHLSDISIVGTIDQVGQDFLEIAEHPAGEPRRPRMIRTVRTVPLTALLLVQSI
jgi:hypothetical protein